MLGRKQSNKRGNKKVTAKRRAATPARTRKQRARMPVVSPLTLKVATVFALCLVALGGFLGAKNWLSNPDNLQIESISWQGAQQEFAYIKREALDQIAEPFLATNLYLLDDAALADAVQAYPWVRNVSLHKSWPRRLVVTIEEHDPVAFWGNDHLMSRYGEVFAGQLPDMQGLIPMIRSPKDNGREMGERYVQITELLDGLDLKVMQLTLDELGEWSMKFREGPEIVIGRKELEKRIRRFRVGYTRGLKEQFNQIRRVDLRYTNGFAVEWKQGAG